MKFRQLLLILAAFVLFTAACGSDDPTSAATDTVADAADVVDDAMSDDEMSDEEASDDDAMSDDAMEDEDHCDDAMADDAMSDDAMSDDAMSDDAMADDEAMEDDAMADDAMADGPQRIVSLNPTGTEMLFAVGAGDQVVAVDNFSYYPPEAPVVDDLSAWSPSIEAIAGFEPDLVVTQGPVEGLDALGVDVLELPAAVTFDDVYSQIEQVGATTGHVGEAAELVLQMQTDIDAVLAEVPDRETALTYYHELDNTLFSVTSSTFVGEVYKLFGLENVADAADPDGEAFGYPQLNGEFLLTADPDLIFLADTLCCEQTAATVAERDGWSELRAVQNGNIVELNDDVVSRWGPRLVEFIQAVGEAVAAVEPAAAS